MVNEVRHEIETGLILENMGLVISIAKQFKPKSKSEFDDYVQAGSIGLLKAIRKFDAEKASLSTWAYKHIKWEIIRQIEAANKSNALSLEQITDNHSIEPEINELLEAIPDYLDNDERQLLILKKAGYSVKDITEMLSMNTYTIGKILKSAVDKIRIANSE